MLRVSEAWSSTAFPGIVVFAGGRVPKLEGERISGAVGRLLARFDVTGGVRVRITGPNCGFGPMLVQVNLRVARTPVRIQTLIYGPGEALPVVLRLERQLLALRETWRQRSWPDPTRLALDAPGAGRITRRKAIALRADEPLTAAAAMDAMDYDTHLFTDSETGEDAIVYRAGPSGLRLARQHHVRPPRASAAASQPGALVTNPRPAPALTETCAVERICDGGLPFLFYTDADTGRGHLLYRRYDADLGLIAPDNDTVEPLP
ncbi:hypothetical protein HLB23_14770 [Nocardia uniformis]|uniref:Sigma 54 modulation/S30EA ribosomal protein C-terminal domain-containing protein n=1 Tax=Nocardia uniformis TaxID=53432 RepID=A0A849BWZ3_9NOCA|nr:sigma 54 modulation/S30EA ribosomal C-terminal domain-containing protein [Nocardia uniformis]NNH71113.1 hypothetical protein [Nocardia uniformis]